MKTLMDFIAMGISETPEQPFVLEDEARNISSILSGLYRQKSESEWEWLKLNRPDWWRQRVRLENALDGHFLNGDKKAGQEVFYRLVEHLKTAPVDHKSTKQ